MSSRDRLMPWSGTGSRVMRVKGQLTDGSRGSRVTKCDPLSALQLSGKAWGGASCHRGQESKQRINLFTCACDFIQYVSII